MPRFTILAPLGKPGVTLVFDEYLSEVNREVTGANHAMAAERVVRELNRQHELDREDGEPSMVDHGENGAG